MGVCHNRSVGGTVHAPIDGALSPNRSVASVGARDPGVGGVARERLRDPHAVGVRVGGRVQHMQQGPSPALRSIRHVMNLAPVRIGVEDIFERHRAGVPRPANVGDFIRSKLYQPAYRSSV